MTVIWPTKPKRFSVWLFTEKSLPISDINNTNIKFKPLSIYRTLHPTIKEYTFFSSTQRPFTKKRSYSKPHKGSPQKNAKFQY